MFMVPGNLVWKSSRKSRETTAFSWSDCVVRDKVTNNGNRFVFQKFKAKIYAILYINGKEPYPIRQEKRWHTLLNECFSNNLISKFVNITCRLTLLIWPHATSCCGAASSHEFICNKSNKFTWTLNTTSVLRWDYSRRIHLETLWKRQKWAT